MLVHRVLILVAAISVIFLLASWERQAQAQAAQGEGSKRGGSGDLMLRIAGDEGTRFSGVCSAGQEEHDISGRVPQSFEYDLGGQKLVCEIREQDAQSARLEIVLKNENTRSVQRSQGSEDTVVRLVYEDGNVSSLMSSTSSQKLNSTSSSSSSAANDATQGDDKQESLADRIQEKVDEILERALP